MARRIADIAALSGEDGIEFDIDSIETELIKEDAEYDGVRFHLTARLEQARVPLQIDIGFGDAVTPEPIAIHFLRSSIASKRRSSGSIRRRW